jgi:SAM-dependent methyltransferase
VKTQGRDADEDSVRDAEFNHPRLVEVYDADCVSTRDDDYFAALVNEAQGGRVLDLGCGTGRLTLRLAAAGHAVTGIDPSAAALAAAQSKAGAGCVTWIRGTVEAAPEGSFDVALMTGHVSQFLFGEDEWMSALRALRRALVPRGRLAFHAYDPAARIWERWNARDSRRQVAIRDGTVEIFTAVTGLGDETVSFSHHYRFPDGETLRSDSTLRFWSEQRIRQSLVDTGFAIERVHYGWRGQTVRPGDGELIFVARW